MSDELSGDSSDANSRIFVSGAVCAVLAEDCDVYLVYSSCLDWVIADTNGGGVYAITGMMLIRYSS